MYVSMTDILQDAHKNNYAVMAVNSINMEMARAVISAAEEERSPIIVNIGMGQMKKHAHANVMVPMIKKLAEEAKVPVALNHDHGQDLDFIIKCIQDGFSSVMIDASSFPFEENVHRTSTIVKLAHPHNICVEAELGHVGQAADGDNSKADLYTDPEQAKKFVELTGVDALAVAVGTAHGSYPKGYVPKLDFERLALLKKTLDMPLVLHGGSGSGEENIRKAVACGINKINVCTDAFNVAQKAMVDRMAENPKADYLDLCMTAEAAMKEFVKNYIRVIGSNNRYVFGEAKIVGHE
ncbi:MAG: class II fructose-bisphosphate aldolase [Erysipelotrichaceae bacterium]|nr:class II fructose-bisphosphate aldolase [Erysipelotrichaceae bacterium]MBQ7890250.1 class II fructose-bisphosphate aldolase [Erysipelotrichaceae bacterium]